MTSQLGSRTNNCLHRTRRENSNCCSNNNREKIRRHTKNWETDGYWDNTTDCSCDKMVERTVAAGRNMPWVRRLVELVVAVAAAEGCFAKHPKTFPGTAEDPRLEMSCY